VTAVKRRASRTRREIVAGVRRNAPRVRGWIWPGDQIRVRMYSEARGYFWADARVASVEARFFMYTCRQLSQRAAALPYSGEGKRWVFASRGPR
jgi:hypothetical protein